MSGRGPVISGGRLRGLRLRVPPGIRPTGGRLREALFDLWAAPVVGARFLDLFAGSGAVGLEALSRGAERVVLVEEAPAALAVLERNLARVDDAAVLVVRALLPAGLARRLPVGARFDLIFADPPYGFRQFAELLAAAEPWLAPGGEMAIEHRWRDALPPAPEPLVAVDRRRYGDSGLAVYRRQAVAAV